MFVADYVTSGDRTPDPNRDSQPGAGGQERLLCFAAADGRLLWQHAYDCPYQISFPGGPQATPTVHGDRVYTLGAEGDLRCLNVADGDVAVGEELQAGLPGRDAGLGLLRPSAC